MKRILLASFACAAAILLNAQANNYPNGSLVANFTVTDTDGNTHNLYDYTAQGKYVILDFFFDTCPPCQATSHYFSQLYQTYGCNDGDIICIAITTAPTRTRRWTLMRPHTAVLGRTRPPSASRAAALRSTMPSA